MTKRKTNINYLRNLKKEIKVTADKCGVEQELVIEVVDDIFRNIRILLVQDKMPEILLSGFGRFKPAFRKIGYTLRTLAKRFQTHLKMPEDSSITDKEFNFLKKRFKRLWAVKQRLIAEDRRLRTWYCWRDLPDDLEGYEECHKPRYENCMPCREGKEISTRGRY